MGKLFVWEFMTLDGVVESPEKWVVAYGCPDLDDFIKAQNLESDALLLGRKTYQDFITFWPSQTHNEFGFADKLNAMPKFVVSTTLAQVAWNNSHLIKSNVTAAIAEMKERSGGSIGLTGSPTLVQYLAQANLIDEYRLMIHPIILGSGNRLFNDGSAMKSLRLVASTTFTSGVVALSYQPDSS